MIGVSFVIFLGKGLLLTVEVNVENIPLIEKCFKHYDIQWI